MAGNTSMTFCLSSYFWVALVVFLLKAVLGINGLAIDLGFVLISLLVMLLCFSSIMSERCGTAPLGAVLGAVLPPWILMVGALVTLIFVFPGWIQPFSNTFGYLVCFVPGINSREKLTAILNPKNKTMSKLIVEDPMLMLNQFSSARFGEIMERMEREGVVTSKNGEALKDFAKIVHIKDSVAELLWHLLVGCVAITTAYNNMMNTVCQKDFIKTVAVSPASALTGSVTDLADKLQAS